jgi:hypothetical protein
MLKWVREKPANWVTKFTINTIGAFICFVVTMMFFITKLAQVWPVFIFLPMIILLFHQIRKHYEAVGEQLRIQAAASAVPIQGNIIVLPVSGITTVVENSLNYAKSLSPDQIIAVYVGFDRENIVKFEEKWKKVHPDIRIVTLYSYYRSIIGPLSKFIDFVNHKAQEHHYNVTVIIPQFVPKKGWHYFLHNQSSLMIREFLLLRKNVVVSTVPFHLKK